MFCEIRLKFRIKVIKSYWAYNKKKKEKLKLTEYQRLITISK